LYRRADPQLLGLEDQLERTDRRNPASSWAQSTGRNFVVFTDKHLPAVNVQGMTGKKRDFSSLPYSKIQAFAVETTDHFDLDSTGAVVHRWPMPA